MLRSERQRTSKDAAAAPGPSAFALRASADSYPP
jgi:hypothetical protein